MSSASSGAIMAALASVRQNVTRVAMECGRATEPRLVAVSKTKPVELLQEAYDAGQRDFGENYVQEIVEKAPLMPPDINWHFIGKVQSNKCKLLAGIPNLKVVETVDTAKLADTLNKELVKAGRPDPVCVFVQVNTSGEEAKGGCEPQDCAQMAQHVMTNCPMLKFGGLMTIGLQGSAEDFQVLARCRAEVCSEVGIPEDEVELSMGMSGDYEDAIRFGSTNVRVGSTIFGARAPKA